MKKYFIYLVMFSVLTVGCETMSDGTKKGAGVGGLVGAAAGGIAGHQSGHGWEGALIGGAAGAVTGGIIGNQMDKKATANNPQHISLVEIAKMGQDGVPSNIIISEIDRTRSRYQLNSEMISYLKQNNVEDRVIDRMLATGN